MIQVQVIKKGASLESEILNLTSKLSEEHTKTLADETKVVMQNKIIEKIARPGSDNKLVNAIEVEKTSNGYGVGNIEKMNQTVPWWRAFNWGSQHMVGKQMPLGTFNPGIPRPTPNDYQGGRWQKLKATPGGSLYAPIVKKAIQATNYIEQTLSLMVSRVQDILK